MAWFKKRRLVIIGENHTDPSAVSFREGLVRKASQKEIFLGLEGLEIDVRGFRREMYQSFLDFLGANR